MDRNTPAYAGKTPLCPRCRVFLRKHPRVCGEDDFPLGSWPVRAETPPRMRGRLKINPLTDHENRNTPAYAGKTSYCFFHDCLFQKHPRVCGEDAINTVHAFRRLETPPRMRGRLLFTSIRLRKNRNTPAYAGKTLRLQPPSTRVKKHPRVCGEDSQVRISSLSM